MNLDHIQILSNLNEEDRISLRKVSGKNDEYINKVISGGIEDVHLKRLSEGMAIIRKYGANSKEYQELMKSENEKAFKRRTS